LFSVIDVGANKVMAPILLLTALGMLINLHKNDCLPDN